jgi:hypothetical protein
VSTSRRGWPQAASFQPSRTAVRRRCGNLSSTCNAFCLAPLELTTQNWQGRHGNPAGDSTRRMSEADQAASGFAVSELSQAWTRPPPRVMRFDHLGAGARFHRGHVGGALLRGIVAGAVFFGAEVGANLGAITATNSIFRRTKANGHQNVFARLHLAAAFDERRGTNWVSLPITDSARCTCRPHCGERRRPARSEMATGLDTRQDQAESWASRSSSVVLTSCARR